MKKGKKAAGVAETMRDEYDFRGGVRGKYAAALKDTTLVALDPDVAAAFPTAESLNNALRQLMRPPPKPRQRSKK